MQWRSKKERANTSKKINHLNASTGMKTNRNGTIQVAFTMISKEINFYADAFISQYLGLSLKQA